MDQEEREAVSEAVANVRAALQLLPASTSEQALELLGSALLLLAALLQPEG